MISKPPKTLEDFQKIRESILELMANPFCDQLMFVRLLKKRDDVDVKIKELNKSKA